MERINWHFFPARDALEVALSERMTGRP